MPKALPSEDSVSTNFTTRALKWLGRLDSNQSMQESKSCALPAWLHPNVKKTRGNGQVSLLLNCHYLPSKQAEEHLSQEMFRNACAFHTFFLGVSQVPEPRKVWCPKLSVGHSSWLCTAFFYSIAKVRIVLKNTMV